MHRALALPLLLAASDLHAADWQPLARWDARCALDAHAVQAHFESKSGDAFEDDMEVTLARDDGVVLPLPVAAALYEPRGTLANVRNACGELTGIDLGRGRLLRNDWFTRVQGVTRAGPWRLNVADVSSGNTGTLKSWCIEVR